MSQKNRACPNPKKCTGAATHRPGTVCLALRGSNNTTKASAKSAPTPAAPTSQHPINLMTDEEFVAEYGNAHQFTVNDPALDEMSDEMIERYQRIHSKEADEEMAHILDFVEETFGKSPGREDDTSVRGRALSALEVLEASKDKYMKDEFDDNADRSGFEKMKESHIAITEDMDPWVNKYAKSTPRELLPDNADVGRDLFIATRWTRW